MCVLRIVSPVLSVGDLGRAIDCVRGLIKYNWHKA